MLHRLEVFVEVISANGDLNEGVLTGVVVLACRLMSSEPFLRCTWLGVLVNPVILGKFGCRIAASVLEYLDKTFEILASGCSKRSPVRLRTDHGRQIHQVVALGSGKTRADEVDLGMFGVGEGRR